MIRPQQPVSVDRPISNRQDSEWSSPPPIDKRRSDMNRCQTESMSFPAAPPPTKERSFMDWSSEGPPRERSVQPIQTAHVVEPQRTELEGEQAVRHRLNERSTTTSVQVHTDQVGPRYVDRETNTSVVNIRSVDDEEAIVDTIHTHGIGIQMPSVSSGLSSSTMDEGEFTTEPCLPTRIPQLDGPLLVRTKRKQPVTILRKQPLISGGDYPSGSESDSHDFRSHKDRRYPGRKGYHQGRGGKPSDKPDREYPYKGGEEDPLEEDDGGPPYRGGPPNDGGPLMEEDPLMVEDPLTEEDPLMMEGPPMVEDPLMMEDPWEMKDHQEDLEDKDHQDLLDHLDQYIQ